MKRTFLALALTMLLGACNTIHGMGEDLSAGGRAISNTASETKHDMDKPAEQ